MKHQIRKLVAIILVAAIPANALAGGMKKSSSLDDLTADLSVSASTTEDAVKEFKASAERAPASFGEPVVAGPFKKTKFEDIVPSMEEFNLMQERMEKTEGVAAH